MSVATSTSASAQITEEDPFPRGSCLHGKKAIYRDLTIARDEIVRVFDVGNNSAKVVRRNGDFIVVPRYWLRPLPTNPVKRPSAKSLNSRRGHLEHPCLHEVQGVASREEAEKLSASLRPGLTGDCSSDAAVALAVSGKTEGRSA